MCKYCASISSEFEYVNLSDSLSAVTESDNRSPNSDLDRIDPNLLVSAYFGNVLAGHINWSGGNETVKYYIYDSASSLNINVWNYAGTSQVATETATTLAHNTDSEIFIRNIFTTLDSLIDIDFEEVYSFDDSDLDIISVSDYSYWSASVVGQVENGADEWNVLWKNTNIGVSLSDFDKNTIVHEIGHSLGLSHPNEDPNNAEWNTVEDTVMSYNSYSGTWGYEFTQDDNSALASIWNSENDDTTAPTISSFSPADNATAVATTSNIVLNFSEAVDVETGNIIIYKVSDDSVVETIDVTSGQVTGTGSTQITINPSNNLAEQTSYYVQIAATAFDDSSSNSYAGISNTTSLSFTTADETAPTFSSAATNTAGTKVILTYNEALSSTTAATSAFSVTSGGSSNSVSSVVISGSTIELTLTTTVKDDETVNFTYTDPSSGNDSYAIQDSSGNDAISLSSTSVTNNSTVSTPITDGVEVAQVNSSYVADSNGFSSVNGSAPVIISAYNIGQETTLDSIKDYDGTLHAGDNLAATASSYKYQGMLDVNGDGVFAAIFTNKSSKRWVTAKVDSTTGQIDFDDNGAGGGTRVVGIYADPLIAEGEQYGGFLSDGTTPAPAAFGATGSDRYVDLNGDGDFNDDNEDRLALNSQVRFQTDLENDNLSAKHAGDYDSDGVHEVYWKTNDGDVYLRSLMHADGNIRYANYQSEAQMSVYLTNNGYASVISDIV